MIPKRDDMLGGIRGKSFDGNIRFFKNKTIKEIIEDYSAEEILNNIDVEEIELYLRKKKLDKITKRTNR